MKRQPALAPAPISSALGTGQIIAACTRAPSISEWRMSSNW